MNEHKGNNKLRRTRRPKTKGKVRGAGNLASGGLKAASSLTRITESWMLVFPASTRRTLRYSGSYTLGAVAGAMSTQVFRANDMFDIDFTGGGHQPMGFDQLMLWYNHFCVLQTKITVNFRNVGGNPATVAIRVDGANTPITVIDRFVEIGGYTMDLCEPKGVYGANKTLSMDIDIAKLQGVSRSAITADPTLRGDAATSPTEVTYFHVACWDSAAAGTTIFDLDIIIDQVAMFLEPRDLVES